MSNLGLRLIQTFSVAASFKSLAPSRSLWCGLLLLFALSGCVQTKSFANFDASSIKGSSERVLLMPTDVLLEELTAGGALLPHAAWTEAAKGNVAQALDGFMAKRGLALVPFDEPDEGLDHKTDQLLKLHEVVGGSIFLHKYVEQLALPTKKNRFDWTLGADAQHLSTAYEADYALFVFFRDSFSTAGRAALIILGAALGVGVSGGQQIGFASLVDLESGNVVWFNILGSSTGDLRDAAQARDATDSLLSDLPL